MEDTCEQCLHIAANVHEVVLLRLSIGVLALHFSPTASANNQQQTKSNCERKTYIKHSAQYLTEKGNCVIFENHIMSEVRLFEKQVHRGLPNENHYSLPFRFLKNNNVILYIYNLGSHLRIT